MNYGNIISIDPNFIALASRESAEAQRNTWSSIERLDKRGDGTTWGIIFPPTSVSWSRDSPWVANSPIAALPYQSYSNPKPWVVSFSLALSTAYTTRRLDEYVDAIASFTVPDKKSFAPPPLAFRQGARTLSPCVLSSANRTETNWTASGELIECTLEIVLIEIPEGQLISS